MKTRKKRRLLTGFSILGAGLLAAFLLNAGHFLTLHEQPEQADVIVVLSPGTERIEAGVRLWKEHYADQIILTRANTGTFTVQEAVALGVPEENVIAEEQAHSTYTNATYTKELMEQRGDRSAIIVTNDYHMRRTKFIFEKVFQGSGLTLSYSSVPSRYEFTAWWDDEESKRMLWKEYAKLAGYYALY
ncbi:YdcF family protein [Domibacillus tundrae]|uniref:YdcF family protein n=1 Tax=Domibacillus tundrae TaxID=1587527 RepID=UPI00339A793C